MMIVVGNNKGCEECRAEDQRAGLMSDHVNLIGDPRRSKLCALHFYFSIHRKFRIGACSMGAWAQYMHQMEAFPLGSNGSNSAMKPDTKKSAPAT